MKRYFLYFFILLTMIIIFFSTSSFALTPANLALSSQQPVRLTKMSALSMNSEENTQKAHGSYQNNTNACASCHQTHTALGKHLLKKEGTYNTCIACHDGTLGVYNVFSPSTAGTFSATPGGNASMHNANGVLLIKSAPGGVSGSRLSDSEISTKGGNWLGEFDCSSCHSPHGSYSDRLLHYNPNNMGNTDVKNGGNKAVLVPAIAFSPTILSQKFTDAKQPAGYQFILVKGNTTQLGLNDTKIGPADTVIALYEWKEDNGQSHYVRTAAPWLYGRNFGTNREYWTQFYKTETPDYTRDSSDEFANIIDIDDEDVYFNFHNGYAYTSGKQLSQVVRGDIAQAYVVKLDKVKTISFGDVPIYAINQSALHQGPVDPKGTALQDPSIKKITSDTGRQVAMDLGKSMSKFCSSCHSDYFAHSGKEMSVFNAEDFRHSTDLDQFNCVRCHFAHGTDVSIMSDTTGKTIRDLVSSNNWTEVEAKAYMLDSSPSSALKRYTGTAVCYACHVNMESKEIFNDPYAQEDQFINMPDLIPYSEQARY